MQIESLNEERLEELRKLWMGTQNPSEREKITAEGKLIKAYLANPRWGSVEIGGNGYCHTCHEQLARVGHYNCLQCAGGEKVNYQSRSLHGMQQALLGWAKDKRLDKDEDTQRDVEKTFNIRFDEP